MSDPAPRFRHFRFRSPRDGRPYIAATLCTILDGDQLIGGLAVVSEKDQANKETGRDLALGRADLARTGGAVPMGCRFQSIEGVREFVKTVRRLNSLPNHHKVLPLMLKGCATL